MKEIRDQLRDLYGGENRRLEDGAYDSSLAVKCVNGTFVGRKTENIVVYRGIPYANAPAGSLRWKAPEDAAADDGVYEAYYNAKSAWGNGQLETGSLYYMDEDCLYLNIWKSDDASAEKKPVMVWIHGGAFEAGGTIDPMFDCCNFVKENPEVIVVTIAYRLGVFGFLHLSHLPDGGEYPDAQNLGLLDQKMALKWVHENIAGFGGDPDNVTIFGESAGAGSCTLLPLLEGSHAYFRRVIAQSGSINLTRSPEKAIKCTEKLMEALGCKTVSDLLKVSGEKLLEASSVIFMHQLPERDGIHLPPDTYEAYENGAAKDITFLVGCNRDEMNFFAFSFGPEGWKKWAADRMESLFATVTSEEKERIVSFFNDVKGENYQKECDLFSQIWFNAPIIRLSENQTKAGGRCYTYHFTPESPDPVMKCGHAIELASVFNHPEMSEDTGRVFDETFSRTMRKMWVQFAKCGNPSLSADISPDGKAHEWPLYDLTDKKVMALDEFDIHPAKEEERKIVDWDRTYFMTKYYIP